MESVQSCVQFLRGSRGLGHSGQDIKNQEYVLVGQEESFSYKGSGTSKYARSVHGHHQATVQLREITCLIQVSLEQIG